MSENLSENEINALVAKWHNEGESSLSSLDLIKLFNHINQILNVHETECKRQKIAIISNLAKSINLGVDFSDLGKKNRCIRYRDPENPSLTWSGRGLMPTWLKQKLEEGCSKDDFLIRQ